MSQNADKANPNVRKSRLPHESDESARGTGKHEKPARTGSDMGRAGKDVERGLVDTERRGIPNDLPSRNRKSP